ncbi:enhanced serine sensitivity protein SseB C-terminal domain-containing protein [Streptomyces sp. TRM 70351]|uniref:enhanced serine sensitivity protein SseB C-terminal domain-containing protein n=1 Tax=Streptomyces sp. TRM 70351 TaxID=3116552 RepID=UPI002E7AB63A|nr:enhanced serine sensitivity protein SseB C-terminal domain-containing protein [Streptomyces sp. TRM 70351]MEE1927380.1 enhanced serine sensitivity protein SseB C-terminal domain-containing protein [Streptomyces sp. TRM 70351]
MSAGGSVEELLRQVTPGRYDAYEALLRGLADGQVWPLLWHGGAEDPAAQYARMEMAGHGYVPCVTSARELAACGWTRGHEAATGRQLAAALYPERYGLWLDPHARGGGVGVPWLDLRRVAVGLDRLPAGPLRISEPTVRAPQFYARLTHNAQRTPVVRSLRRGWVQPAHGAAFLAIGVDLYDPAPQASHTALDMVRDAAGAVPEGLPLATVAMSDAHDPVAMWLRAHARPFFDRDAQATAPVAAPAPAPGYGYPRPY